MNAREARVRTDIRISGQSREESIKHLEIKYKEKINSVYELIVDRVNNKCYTCTIELNNDEEGRETGFVLLHHLRKLGYTVEVEFDRSDDLDAYNFDIMRFEISWEDA